MNMIDNETIFMQPLSWTRKILKEKPFVIYECFCNNQELVIAHNDFPDEVQYSLSINGRHFCDFDDWPKKWVKS